MATYMQRTRRFVTLPNVMRAKKKAIEALSPAELGVDPAATPQLEAVAYADPPKRKCVRGVHHGEDMRTCPTR